MKKILALFSILVMALSSCEKDDICDANTPTTPRLVLEFYDINNPTVLKNVTNLKAFADGKEEAVVFNTKATDDSKYLANTNKVLLPLNTNATQTSYKLTLNALSGDANFIFDDLLVIKYNTKNEYVSRACGYKTLFTLAENQAVTHQAASNNKEAWIKQYTLITKNINSENEVHLKIYF